MRRLSVATFVCAITCAGAPQLSHAGGYPSRANNFGIPVDLWAQPYILSLEPPTTWRTYHRPRYYWLHKPWMPAVRHVAPKLRLQPVRQRK